MQRPLKMLPTLGIRIYIEHVDLSKYVMFVLFAFLQLRALPSYPLFEASTVVVPVAYSYLLNITPCGTIIPVSVV